MFSSRVHIVTVPKKNAKKRMICVNPFLFGAGKCSAFIFKKNCIYHDRCDNKLVINVCREHVTNWKWAESYSLAFWETDVVLHLSRLISCKKAKSCPTRAFCMCNKVDLHLGHLRCKSHQAVFTVEVCLQVHLYITFIIHKCW